MPQPGVSNSSSPHGIPGSKVRFGSHDKIPKFLNVQGIQFLIKAFFGEGKQNGCEGSSRSGRGDGEERPCKTSDCLYCVPDPQAL